MQVTDAIRDGHVRLDGIVRAAPIGIGVVLDRCFVEVNSRFCAMTGYTADELLGSRSRMLYPTEEEFEYAGRVQYGQICESGIGTMETRFRRKDGEMIDVLLTSSPIDPDTPARGVTFAALDITDRKRAESLLRVQQDLAQALSVCRTLTDALPLCVRAAIRISGFDGGGVYLTAPDTGNLDLVYSQGLSAAFAASPSTCRKGSPNAQIVARGRPVFTSHATVSDVSLELQASEGVQAAAILPMLYEGRVIGCLHLVSRSGDTVDEGTRNALEGIAAQVGGPIARLRAEEALAESREKYRSVFEYSPEMVSLMDSNGILMDANSKVEELLLYDRGDLLGKRFEQFPFWSNVTKSEFSGLLGRLLSGNEIVPHEMEFCPRTGGPLTCRVHGTKLGDGGGAISHVLLLLTNVTDQRLAERALSEEEKRARNYLDVAGVILVALDTNHHVTLINRKGCAVLQRTEEEIVGRDWLEIAIPKSQREISRIVLALLLKGDTQSVEYFENSVVTADGVERIIAWRNTVVRDASGVIVGTLSSGEDITERTRAETALRERTEVLEREVAERRRAEHQLRESREDFRRLAGRVLSAQESERSRIARELHDDITQRLALMAIEAAGVLSSTPELSDAGRATLDGLQRRLETVAADVQAVSRVLHPAILKDLGLEDAVASECVAFQSREGIETTCDVAKLPGRIGDEVALCQFRILQEGLWNVAKHSCAANVQVSLHYQDGDLVLAIGDDGVGFDVDEGRGKRGLGLASMQERAHLVGGTLTIDSQPNMGTMIEARVPLLELFE